MDATQRGTPEADEVDDAERREEAARRPGPAEDLQLVAEHLAEEERLEPGPGANEEDAGLNPLEVAGRDHIGEGEPYLAQES